jgi:hypothetical protein
MNFLSKFTPKCSGFSYFLTLYVQSNVGVGIQAHYNSHLSVHINGGVAIHITLNYKCG